MSLWRTLSWFESMSDSHLPATANRSVLREQVIQIRLREAAGEAFLAQHVADRLRLALLEFPDFFLHRARRDEAVGVHRLRLADAVGAVNGLRLHRRIPPRIVKHHVAGRDEVQPRARRAQA